VATADFKKTSVQKYCCYGKLSAVMVAMFSHVVPWCTALDVHYCMEGAPFFLIAFALRSDPQGAATGNWTAVRGPFDWQTGALTIVPCLTPFSSASLLFCFEILCNHKFCDGWPWKVQKRLWFEVNVAVIACEYLAPLISATSECLSDQLSQLDDTQ